MMGRTHAVGGLASLWLLRLVPGIAFGMAGAEAATAQQSNVAMLAVLATLGALLPDLDASESQLKHWTLPIGSRRQQRQYGFTPFALPATMLHETLGHRNLLHSAVGFGLVAFVVGLPLGLWLGWTAAAALLLGCASHLFLDACTKSGIRLWFPSRTRFHALPPALRIVTGSPEEEIVFIACALLAFILFLLMLSTSNPLGSGGQL